MVAHSRQTSVSSIASTEASTPAATEGETATESEELITETETETEADGTTPPARATKRFGRLSPSSVSSKDSLQIGQKKRQTISQHDLFHRYFRKDTLLLHNIDLLRYGLL